MTGYMRLGDILATPNGPPVMVGDKVIPFFWLAGRKALTDLQLVSQPWLAVFVEDNFDDFERDDDWALWFWTVGETPNVVRDYDS